MDTSGDGVVSYTELDQQLDRVYAIVKRHFLVTANVPLVRMSAEHAVVVNDHVLQMDLALIFTSDVSDLTIRSTFDEVMRPDHQHATRVTIAGASETATLNAVTPQATFVAGGSRAAARFVRLGMDQRSSFARYDALALLAVLLVAASTPGALAKVLAPFTLAHGVALGLVASGLVVLPARAIRRLLTVPLASCGWRWKISPTSRYDRSRGLQRASLVSSLASAVRPRCWRRLVPRPGAAPRVAPRIGPA